MSIKDAIKKATKQREEETEKNATEAMRFQAVCQQFMDYLRSEEGKETLELLGLVPNNEFLVAWTRYKNSCGVGPRFDHDILRCSFHGGFRMYSDDSSGSYTWYVGEEHAKLLRSTEEDVIRAITLFQRMVVKANDPHRQAYIDSTLEGKKIEDFLSLFKKGVEGVAERVSSS